MPKITQKQYRQSPGDACPMCGWTQLEFIDAVSKPGEHRQTAECPSCISIFYRVFKLDRYELR